MKTSSAPEVPPLTRGKAVNCLILNQLATPGLGTWMAGRKVEGSLQLLASGTGFTAIVAWFVFFFINQIRQISDLPSRSTHGWLGWGGLILFGIAWCWSLVSSLLILRSAAPAAGG